MIRCINCCYRVICDKSSSEIKECNYYKHISSEVKKIQEINDNLIKEIRNEKDKLD